MKATDKRTLTAKQERVIKGIVENRSAKKPKPLKAIMLEAGYSEASAIKPSQSLKSPLVQERLQAFLATMDTARRLHLKELLKKEKVEGVDARDNAYIMDILVKNERLLTGQSTNNTAIHITISESIADKNAPDSEKPA